MRWDWNIVGAPPPWISRLSVTHVDLSVCLNLIALCQTVWSCGHALQDFYRAPTLLLSAVICMVLTVCPSVCLSRWKLRTPFNCIQCWNCREFGGSTLPPVTSTDSYFWVKICFKFQSLGKIANISTSDTPPSPSSFRLSQKSNADCWYAGGESF